MTTTSFLSPRRPKAPTQHYHFPCSPSSSSSSKPPRYLYHEHLPRAHILPLVSDAPSLSSRPVTTPDLGSGSNILFSISSPGSSDSVRLLVWFQPHHPSISRLPSSTPARVHPGSHLRCPSPKPIAYPSSRPLVQPKVCRLDILVDHSRYRYHDPTSRSTSPTVEPTLFPCPSTG